MEACGLLFGNGTEIIAMQAVDNVSESPERAFEIDPRALIKVLKAERSGGPKVAGYWHSHPSGDAAPSVIDAAMAAADGKLWLIVADGDAGLWRAVEDGAVLGRFEAIGLTVI